MLREGTALAAIWFSLLLLAGLYRLGDGAESWVSFVSFLSNPLIMVVNLIALGSALLHTKTWFDLAPKAGPESRAPLIKGGLWSATSLASLLVLGAFFLA